jgi:hypothetical protein
LSAALLTKDIPLQILYLKTLKKILITMIAGVFSLVSVISARLESDPQSCGMSFERSKKYSRP